VSQAQWRSGDNPSEHPTTRDMLQHQRTCEQICDDGCDLIEWDIIDTEVPNEVVDVADMLLMGLRGKECFKEPFAVMNLEDVPKLLRGMQCNSA
jgi:hypothetical protein